MFQRIQTIYLLITLILTSLLFYLPVANITVSTEICDYYVTKVVAKVAPTTEIVTEIATGTLLAWNIYSLILVCLLWVVYFIVLFLYKKRALQLRLCVVSIVLSIGLFVLLLLQINSTTTAFLEEGQMAVRQFRVPLCFPILSAICAWLASRGILNDILLLKSFDRIR